MRASRWRAARVASQAKVNLFLRVLAREPNGYHRIETLFCRLDLADAISIRPTNGPRTLDVGGIAIPAAGLGPVEKNLAWRAAVAYSERTGWPGGFTIELDKRIPVGGGLGGGSSNAGAVLHALNALAPNALHTDELLQIAASLGADVPFLTTTAALALATGRGERLISLPALPARPVLLVCFPFGVPTGEAYGWLAATRAADQAIPSQRTFHPAKLASWAAVASLAENDFERVVPSRFPPIASALLGLRALQSRGTLGDEAIVLLCGSGATVMAVGGVGWQPETASGQFPEPDGVRLVATSTVSRVEEVQMVE
jgi:4-diphosphocytidyl-2-C-methyl-D-erythritol kinase